MNKTALVIGITGLVGRGIALELQASGMQVTGAARGKTRRTEIDTGMTMIIVDRSITGSLKQTSADISTK